MLYDEYVNLQDFYKYIINKEMNLETTESHIIETLKQIKQYSYKYYKSQKLAFDINDEGKKCYINFELNKKLYMNYILKKNKNS